MAVTDPTSSRNRPIRSSSGSGPCGPPARRPAGALAEPTAFGTLVPGLDPRPATAVVPDDSRAARFAGTPWLRAWVAGRSGLAWYRPGATGGDAFLPPGPRHLLGGGATGMGKTRAQLHVLSRRLEAGASAVVVDPKGELFDLCLARAAALGLSPHQVTVLDPRSAEGIPGWNFLAGDVPLAQAVGDCVSLLRRLNEASWGPRLEALLGAALWIAGSHGLSPFEAHRLLLNDPYREGLLRLPTGPPDELAYAEARHYFEREFAGWSRSERANASAAVTNKLGGEMLRSPFLRPLLCARRNTLDLGRLWREQHLVLVRLDGPELGDGGARLLAGLLAHQLLRTALRARRPRPVVLLLDELPVLERLVGGAVADIVTLARSTGLSCHVAFQHLGQLSDSLRATLLANCGTQLFFRLGPDDARHVAASLSAGTEPGLARVVVGTDGVNSTETVSCRHLVRDGQARPLRMAPDDWEAMRSGPAFASDPVAAVAEYAARAGTPRLWVMAADTGQLVPLRDYVRGLRPGEEYRIDGPGLAVTVRFPRPRLRGAERWSDAEAARAWTRRLQSLPPRHCALRVDGGPARVVRVTEVAVGGDTAAGCFLAAARSANGQSVAEADAAARGRAEAVERLAAGREPDGTGMAARDVIRSRRQEADDGSLS